ncbi:hypothetical protein EV363DRAFT_1205889, partial [Boletus edulis]
SPANDGTALRPRVRREPQYGCGRAGFHGLSSVSTSAVLLYVVCYLQRSSRPLKRSCATSSNSVPTVSPASCGAVSSCADRSYPKTNPAHGDGRGTVCCQYPFFHTDVSSKTVGGFCAGATLCDGTCS